MHAIFFRNISVTRNPCNYRPSKAHFATLHPAWHHAGGNGLLPGNTIPKAHPAKGSKSECSIGSCTCIQISSRGA